MKWLALFVLLIASTAHAQFYGADSAEKVHSALVTAIPIGQTITSGSPFKVAITAGTGPNFARIPKPFIVTCAPQAENANTPIEEFVCSAVSNDTLTLNKRALSNTIARTWSTGSYIGYRLTAVQLKKIQDSIGTITLNSGTVSSIVFASPLTGGTITSTGTVTIPQADATHNGYLASADWNTFTGKQNTVTVSTPLQLAGGTAFSILKSDATHNGYLSSTDWNTFNNKSLYPDSTGKTGDVLSILAGGGYNWVSAGSGTMTSLNVSGGSSGLTFGGGPITSTGTIQISGGTLALSFGGTGAGTAAGARVNILPDTTGKTLKYLRVINGGGIIWDTATGSGSSAVTSVAQTVPTFLSISGSPITASGTLAITLSGTALPYSSGGTGQTAWTKGDILYASATNVLSKLGIGTTGQLLTVANGLPSWATSAAGTVTSVDMTLPAFLSVSGNPITTSGTLAVTLASESANTALMAPDGSSGTPTFRTLVTGDIPSLDVAKITSGSFSVARGGTGLATITAHTLMIGNGTSALTLSAVGGANTVLGGNAAADPTYKTLATDATLVGNGIGTSFGLALSNANTWTGAITESQPGIAATYTTGLTLQNTTASTSGATVQQSPTNLWVSHGWSTTSTAADSEVDMRTTLIPVSAANATSKWNLDFGNANLGFTNKYSFASGGTLTATAFSGDGSNLTGLNASNLSTGTIATGRVSGSYTGITGVGTLTAGTWNATTIAVANGGTGLATLTAHALQVGNGTSAITQLGLGTTTTLLHGNASGDPTWSAVSLTGDITGTLLPANGGTGATTLTTHGVLIGEGTSAIVATAPGIPGMAFMSNGSSLDPSHQFYTPGFSAEQGVSSIENTSGAGSSNAQVKTVSDPLLTATAPIVLQTYGDVNTVSGSLAYVSRLDSTLRASGQYRVSVLAGNGLNINNNNGCSLFALSPLSVTNGMLPFHRIPITTSGSSIANFDTVLSDASVLASSVVLITPEVTGNAGNAANVHATLSAFSAGSFTLRLNWGVTTNIVSGSNRYYLNYAVINPTMDGKIVTGKGSFTSGSSQQNFLDTITDAHANGNSYIFVTCIEDANSEATTQYDATVEPIANWPAGKFIIRFCRYAHASALSIGSGKGCSFHYAIVNNIDTLTTQDKYTFGGAAIADPLTSNQIVLGTGTTTTLSATAPALNATYTIPDWGATSKFAGSVNGINIPDTASNGGKVLTAGTGGGAPTWSAAIANPNTATATPSNPAGTASGTVVMMGLNSPFTPTKSGAVVFTISGNINSGATGVPTAQIYYGTGAAPVNGAAVTGTATGGKAKMSGLANGSDFVTLTGLVTGLTAGTAYWFDVGMAVTGTATSSTITDIYTQAIELK